MEQKIGLFDSVEELIDWYNYVKPHMSLDFDELETPERAFWIRLPSERVFELSGGWFFEE